MGHIFSSLIVAHHASLHLHPLVAFYDMQENTAVQFCHPEIAGEPPLSAIYDMQENTAALFFVHPEYSRGATTSEHMYEKGFGSYQTA